MRKPTFTTSTHRACRTCGRLLAPQSDGLMPLHRSPANDTPVVGRTAVSLTGPDAPWCKGDF